MIDENGTLDLTGIKELNENTYTYSHNKKLKKLIIGNTIEEIRKYSFFGCSNLEEIDFSNTILKKISYQCFYFCLSLKSIHLPSSIKSIESRGFSNCHHLKSIILDGVNEISFFAFEDCFSLEEFIFYENIEIFIKNLIKKNIFKGIKQKQKIKINCPNKYVNYFKQRFIESEINTDNQYVLK